MLDFFYNLLKKKEKDVPKEYEGTFITDDQIYQIIGCEDTFGVKNNLNEINDLLNELKNYEKVE